MYSALDIAEYVVGYCNENNFPISNLRLQKLLYFVQAEFLVATKTPCFKENIEAWSFGPVVPEVYHKYKFYGGLSICSNYGKSKYIISNLDQNIIARIVSFCEKFSTKELVEITHNQDPWIISYNYLRHNVIPNETIKSFFDNKIKH